MYYVELIKVDHDNVITFSSGPVNGYSFDSLENAVNQARWEAACWYNHAYDYVLINDENGACIYQYEIEYDYYGNELFITLDHYDWSSVINEVLHDVINEVGYSADISQFCYCDEFKRIVKPFEPVGGQTKKVRRDDWENMQDDLEKYFIDTLENMENEE